MSPQVSLYRQILSPATSAPGWLTRPASPPVGVPLRLEPAVLALEGADLRYQRGKPFVADRRELPTGGTALIAAHWDDLLRVAGSLRQGTVGASELLRTLQQGGHAAALARAVAELGRIAKSLYLLAYMDDEAHRRRVLTQLNRGEGRHSLARAVFHGQKGELRQRYREGHEDQLGALGLVVNLLVLWTTRYMDLALAQLRREGVAVRDEDVARLSPLGYAHVNLLGRYHFTLPEAVAQGAVRPLGDPEEGDDTAGVDQP